MTETRLWLIRHGEPHPDTRGRCYGRLDVGLSDRGREQMRHVALRVAGETFTAVYASPRIRALESARHLARTVTPVEDLREIDFGDFEGRTYDEIARTHPEVYRQWMETPTEVHFPNGESFARMQVRVTRALAALRERHAGKSIAVVTHGGVIRIALAEALGIPAANVFRLGQHFAALNLVRYLDDHPIVELVNA